MTLWTHYHTPSTIDETLALLASYHGRARVMAGGTDLLLDIRQGNTPRPDALVDISRIAALNQIDQDGDVLIIGAGVTHAQIVASPVLAARATCLVEGCGVVGGPQVRNVGTLGGNVAHALPAGDGTTSLVALDAEATAFKRIMRPQGVALPILGCATWLRLDESGERYDDVRVCVGPVAQVPVRATDIEAALRGQPVSDETLDRVVSAAHESLRPRTSKYRATADYRREMVEVLLRRVLPLAVQRARTGQAVPEGVGME
jgi:CO/xanthine dehydrogenase FAD-binding subunit